MEDLDNSLIPALMTSADMVPLIQGVTRISTALRLSTRSRSSGSHEFCDEVYPPLHKQLGATQSAAAIGRPAPHGSGARRSDQRGQEELSHVFEYEAPSQPYPPGPSTSGRDSVGSLLSDEAAAQADKPGTLEVLRQDLDTLGRETRELHGRVDSRAPAAALKELRRGLDALSYELLPKLFPFGTVIRFV
ncbi:hypothetical protein PHPALM_31431 [Phytophthora palmivora]|uniref:Uncharacterized protein n=1 Tax=Phytophthora palmivora TaxID=4796 RepID=A0A2P4X2K6_9STRA|nr:hypothetical protein PHPALM_31431 [Phytophthora palmivora]